MGCDIHLYKEKCINGQWETADIWEPSDYGDGGLTVKYENRFTDRNYELFGLLSKGVRREHAYSLNERGMPFDVCAELAQESESWGCDGHSHSYLYLHELKSLAEFCKTKTILISGMKNSEELRAFRESIASDNPDWNLLFPYCGMTTASDSENFEQEVPATFYFGDALQRIIDSFDGIDGDNHRIVFWFDN